MLHLSSAANHHPSATEEQLSDQPLVLCQACGSTKKPPLSPSETAAESAEPPPEKNTNNKTKRSNCVFSSSLQEPHPKRFNSHGYIKLPLQETATITTTPSPLKHQFPPPLYRTFSDPTGSASYKQKSPAPPPHTALARTTSWPPNLVQNSPTPSPHNAVATTTISSPKLVQDFPTPPHNAIARTTVSSPNLVQDSPTTMRYKRMKDSMRQMSQWFSLMIADDDDDDETPPQETNILKGGERETGSGEAHCEEDVWVERKGDYLILHFKCPCGKGYEILLSGNKCFYKLTDF